MCFCIMKEKRMCFNNKENSTLYDEFVCSEFAWLPINRQKENARRLEQMTRGENETE